MPALIGAIGGTSKENFYEELVLERCHWYRKLSYFYKFYKNEFLQYLFKLILVRSSEYSTRSMQNVPFFKTRHNFLKKYFFRSAILQWNNLDLNIRIISSLNIFRNNILKFIASSVNSVFNSHNPKAIEFITSLRLVQSHLPEQKFKHSFQDLLKLISNCRLDIESSLLHLLDYPTYNMERLTLLSTLKNIDNKLLDLTKQVLTKTLHFGSNSFNINTNANILNVTVNLVYLLKDLAN